MGKHSKPTSTGRCLARLGTIGALIGGPMLATAGTGHAASDSTWDRLAQCESSGNWSINTGNGYSGGLQFSPHTWDAFRGKAGVEIESAHDASRAQQIAVAEYVLAAQGWGAWPACSRKLGLREASEPRTPPTAPERVEEQSAPVRTVEPAPTRERTAQAPARATRAALPPDARMTPPVGPPASGAYVVVRGDTLTAIALAHHTTWQRLAELNGRAAGGPVEHADWIFPGEVLRLA